MKTRRITLGISLIAPLLLVGCGESKIKKHLAQGEQFYKEGKYDEAKIEFMNLRQRDPLNATAHARLGEIWLYQGSAIQAAPYLLEAHKLDPDNLETIQYLAETSISLGALRDARSYAEKLLEKAPESEQGHLLLATSAWTSDLRKETMKLLEGDDLADSSGAAVGRGLLLAKKKDFEGASRAIDEALRLDDENPHAWLMKGKLLQEDKKLVESGAALKKAAEASRPRSAHKVEYVRYLLASKKRDEAREYCRSLVEATPGFLGIWVILAEFALADQNTEKAKEFLENVLQRDPRHMDARLLQATVQLVSGDAAKSLENLKEVRTLYQANAVVEKQIGVAFLANGMVTQARQAFGTALELQPGNVEVRLTKAKLDIRMGEPQLVVDSLAKVLSINPNIPTVHSLLAKAYAMLGQIDAAEQLFRKRLETHPDDFQAHVFLAMFLRQKNENSEARKLFEAAALLEEKNLLPTFQLASLDLQEDAPDAALARIEEILQENPDSADTYAMLGKLHMFSKNWDEAERSLLKAVELNENHFAAYELLIACYVTADKLDSAEKRLAQVFSKRPQDASTVLQLALVQEKAGRLKEAEKSYGQALKLAGQSPLVLNSVAWFYAEKLNDPKRAIELAQRARAALPEEGAIADTLGWIFHRQKDYSRAIVLLREAVGRMPANAEVQYHLGATAYILGLRDEAREALTIAAQAKIAFEGQEEAKSLLARLDGTGSETIAELEARHTAQPEDVLLLISLAKAYVEAKQLDKAISRYERVLKLSPDQLESLLALSRLLLDTQKDPKQALVYATKARELDPSDGRALALIAQLRMADGLHAEAFSLYQQAVQLGVDDPRTHKGLAWAAYRTGDLASARAAMQKVADKLDDAASAETTDFLELIEPEKPEELLDRAKAILAKDGDFLPAAFLLADSSVQAGRFEEVRPVLEQQLKKNPGFTPAKRALALTYLGLKTNLPKAKELGLEVRRLHPGDSELAQALGEISFHLKDYAAVVSFLEQLPDLSAPATYYLGVSQLKDERKVEMGVATLRKALELNLEEPLLSSAKRLIEDNSQ